MTLAFEQKINGKSATVGVIGLGYAGLPLIGTGAMPSLKS